MNFAALIKQVEIFCRRGVHRMRRDARVSLEHLTESLVFHAMGGTLAVVWEREQVVGVAIAWQTTRAQILAAEREHKSVFDWRPSRPDGDAVYLAFVLTAVPRAMRPLANYFLARFPHWAALPLLAHRHGQLRTVTGLLNRLAGFGGASVPASRGSSGASPHHNPQPA